MKWSRVDPETGLTKVILEPGDYYACGGDALIATTLGTCIAVCLRDPLAGVAGMNHFALPEILDDSNVAPECLGRYGVHAMPLLIKAIERCGGAKERLQAKILGGGYPIQLTGGRLAAGSNVAFAEDYLNRLQIPVLARDVGGETGRSIVFRTGTGSVKVDLHTRPEEARIDGGGA